MLKKVYFEKFKCFEKSEMQFENLTILIGANASGKTNMIEGMMILSEIMTGRDLSVVLDGSKNESSSIRGGAKGCCRFGADYFILGCLVRYDENTDLEYRIKVGVTDRILVEYESLYELKGNNRKMMFCTKDFDVNSGDIAVACNNGQKGRNPDIICIRFAAVIGQIATKLPQDTKYGKKIVEYSNKVITSMKNILFLNPETSSMRSYSHINDIEIKVNASNISSVLNHICKDCVKKEEVLKIMKQLPENEITDITFVEGPLNDVILFLQEKNGQRTEKIDAARLSDGSLRCLAIVAAVLSEEEGGMIVIEEVDNGLHPGRAKILIKVISDLAKQRNVDVLITTHNAILLNALTKENLTGVNVVYRDDTSGAGEFVPFVQIQNMPRLLANGKLGDVFTNDILLKYIKEDKLIADYSWLEV